MLVQGERCPINRAVMTFPSIASTLKRNERLESLPPLVRATETQFATSHLKGLEVIAFRNYGMFRPRISLHRNLVPLLHLVPAVYLVPLVPTSTRDHHTTRQAMR